MVRLVITWLISIVALSGCIGRTQGWSRARYEWWSTVSPRHAEEIFGPFTLSEAVELHTKGWSAHGEFMPRSPDGYNLLLRGYVVGTNGVWREDLDFPQRENTLYNMLCESQAEVEVKVSCMGQEMECRRIAISDSMKSRSQLSDANGVVYHNYYPLMRIETASFSPSSPISVLVTIIKPDVSFSKYKGRIVLQLRGCIETW